MLDKFLVEPVYNGLGSFTIYFSQRDIVMTDLGCYIDCNITLHCSSGFLITIATATDYIAVLFCIFTNYFRSSIYL